MDSMHVRSREDDELERALAASLASPAAGPPSPPGQLVALPPPVAIGRGGDGFGGFGGDEALGALDGGRGFGLGGRGLPAPAGGLGGSRGRGRSPDPDELERALAASLLPARLPAGSGGLPPRPALSAMHAHDLTAVRRADTELLESDADADMAAAMLASLDPPAAVSAWNHGLSV